MDKQTFNKQAISITESPSNFDNLDKMSVNELLSNINKEDSKVHLAVRKALPQIEELISHIFAQDA